MNKLFFYTAGSDIKGPTNLENIFSIALRGKIQEDSKVSLVDKEKWHLAKDVEGIFSWHLYCPVCDQRLLADYNVYDSNCSCPACGNNILIPPPNFHELNSQEGIVLLDTNEDEEDTEKSNAEYLDLIRQNPYYVIGIFAGATQRSIKDKKARINAFQKIGKKIEAGIDIDIFGTPERSNSLVEKAFASIDINGNRLSHSLFWFTNHNHLDDAALNYVKSGDIAKAEEIWRKATEKRVVTQNNFSAFNNLGTLKLGASFESESFNPGNLREGVLLKTELLFSEFFVDFCHLVADETYTVDPAKELERFLQSLINELEDKDIAEAEKVLPFLSQSHSKLKKFISEKFSQRPLSSIEYNTKKVRKQIKNNRSQGLNLAKRLYLGTSDNLNFLYGILGGEDLKYQKAADKLAGEISHCCCDCFNDYVEFSNSVNDPRKMHDAKTEIEMGQEIIATLKLAEAIAVADKTKDRIDDNIDVIKQWTDDAHSREKYNLVADDIEFIQNKLSTFNQSFKKKTKDFARNSIKNSAKEVSEAEELIVSCRPKLQNIRNQLNERNKLYLKISNAVVSNAQGLLVKAVNEVQKDSSLKDEYGRSGRLKELRDLLQKATVVSNKLGSLDMDSELRSHYEKNHRTIEFIASRSNLIFLEQSVSATTSSNISAQIFGTLIWIGIIFIFILLGTCAE